jgi:hypothetical protein
MVAREVVLADQPGLSAIVLKSPDDAGAWLQRIQNGMTLLVLLSLAGAAAVSFYIRRLLRSTAA